jgi:hypothetical protein
VLEALLVAVASRLHPHRANLAIQTFGTRVGSTFPDGVQDAPQPVFYLRGDPG